MAKKVQDDINDLNKRQQDLGTRLDQEIAKLKASFADDLAAEGKRLAVRVADGAKRAEEAVAQQTHQQADMGNRMQAQIAEVRVALDSRIDDVIVPEFAKVRIELAASAEKLGGQLSEEAELRAQGESDVLAVANEAADLAHMLQLEQQQSSERTRKASKELADKHSSDFEAAVAALDRRCNALQGTLDLLTKRLCGDEERKSDDVGALEKKLKDMHAATLAELKEGLAIAEARSHDTSVGFQLALRNDFENLSLGVNSRLLAVHQRSVFWRIHKVVEKLARAMSLEDRSIGSVTFKLCGLFEISLQLQIASSCQNEPDSSAPAPPFMPPLPVPGSCSLKVWAPQGVHIKFRITLGGSESGSPGVSRRFEHTSEAPSASGGGYVTSSSATVGAPFAAPNLCQLDQIWTRAVDRIDVGFELLDLRLSSSASSTGVVDLRASEVAPVAFPLPPPTRPFAMPPATEELHGEAGWPPDELTLCTHVASEELERDRFKSQLDVLHNKSVRHIEWRVEGCAKLLEVSRPGEAISSPIFNAAGVDRWQFTFYPRGCDSGPTAGPTGPSSCALFISGAARTALRGTLWVGSHSRQVDHRFKRLDDRAGRTKFCSLEHQIDCTDTIVVALDIVEVQTDLPDTCVSLVLRETPSLRGAGGENKGDNGGVEGYPSPDRGGNRGAVAVKGAKGSIRMRRGDPEKTEEIMRCASLPTFNARDLRLPHVRAAGGSLNAAATLRSR